MSAAAARLRLPEGEGLFAACVAGSLAAHLAVASLDWAGHGAPEAREVEFDLTLPAALGAAGKPAGGRRAAAKPESWAPAPAAAPDAERADAPPAADAEDASLGAGDAAGGGGGSGVTAPPRLVRGSQLERLLERYYPEAERRAGHEGLVLLDLSIDEEGHVVGVEVAGSSDPAFESAARQVAARLVYEPARAGERKVSVKLRQPIQFRLGPP